MYNYVEVIIEFAKVEEIDRPFTYKVPQELTGRVKVGCRVKVPFGRGRTYQLGYVVWVGELEKKPDYTVKNIVALVDQEPILNEEQLEIAKFLVEYYGASYAASIHALVPPGLKGDALESAKVYKDYLRYAKPIEEIQDYIEANVHKKTFAKQRQVLESIVATRRASVKTISDQFGDSSSSIKTLITKGYVEKFKVEEQLEHQPVEHSKFRVLNEEQQEAYTLIQQKVSDKSFGCILLDGVTGSGKTEVFLHAIRDVVERGESAIVLVPEIALTKQTLERFTERFGSRVALSHSRMSKGERQRLFMRAKSGEISIVIGARSAVFAPLKNLGLIVVDEEHETTYKSETAPKYDAIEVARMRMQRAHGVVILASATPSMESYKQSIEGEIQIAKLSRRAGGAMLPEVELVDMRTELRGGNGNVISQKLHWAIHETLEAGRQVMLLVNRRGHSTFINCRNCGYVVKCEHCDVSMTYHLRTRTLECHHCGSKKHVPKTCPKCESKYIRFFGNGTQKVEEYLNTHFEKYGVVRMDFDTTTGKEGHAKVLQTFESGRAGILVGTQMIAKGHDFKNVTLVGVVAADSSLYIEDFRSEERTFQLLTQIVGRAGRGDEPGRVIIQTYNPENMVLERVKYAKKEAFYEEELSTRELMQYPPYTHVFSVLISGKDEKTVINSAHMLTSYYKYYNKKSMFRIIGPVPAVLSKIADEYRWKITIIGNEREKVLIYGKFCLNKFIKREITDTIKVSWDIDPLGSM